MNRKIALLIVSGLALGACQDAAGPLAPESAPGVAPVVPHFSKAAPAASERIAGQYIVVFDETVRDVPGLARQLAAAHGGSLGHVYGAALKGFSAKLPDAAAAALARNPHVVRVEQDQVMRAFTTQSNATWGLDRVDQRDLPLSGSFTYTPTGAGVSVYIIDTGIRFDHTEFGGRAVSGYDVIDGGTADDCNGHGTHVAGTVGGGTYGVAKGAKLVAVRVLGCDGSGTLSGVIAGIDWVTANHVKPALANMSLGGGASSSLDDAVRKSISKGVTYAVAAGNSNADACYYSPARVGEALTVGASTSSDARASFSNYGSCLDVFAPGESITSAWYSGSTATISGTSMASPHVAGVAALYLQGNPGASPSTVANAITSTATTERLTGVSGSPNKLVYSTLTTDGNTGGNTGGDAAPCTNCTLYTGTLSGSGDSDQLPNGTYYQSPSGTHKGWLRADAGTDFDLYLYKWYSGWGWVAVASSTKTGSDEQISYQGSSGYYTWLVRSYSGSGSYSFWLTKP